MGDNKTLIISEQLTLKCRRKEPYPNISLLYFNIVCRSFITKKLMNQGKTYYLKLQIFWNFE